jgi:hypothetical protein
MAMPLAQIHFAALIGPEAYRIRYWDLRWGLPGKADPTIAAVRPLKKLGKDGLAAVSQKRPW